MTKQVCDGAAALQVPAVNRFAKLAEEQRRKEAARRALLTSDEREQEDAQRALEQRRRFQRIADHAREQADRAAQQKADAAAYRAKLDAEAAARQAERQAALDAEAAIHEKALSAYRAAGSPPNPLDDDYASAAEIARGGAEIRRDRLDEISCALRYVLDRSAPEIIEQFGDDVFDYVVRDDCYERFEPCARHWYVVRDLSRVAPLHASGSDKEAFARSWRESIPDLKGAEMLVKVEPGKPVEAAMCNAVELSDGQVRAWCGNVEDGERFKPLLKWETPDESEAVHLPAVTETAAALPKASDLATVGKTGPKLLTGIAALDRLPFGAPGLAQGSLVVAAGKKTAGKTSLYFEIAQAALAAGWSVLWAAHDEKPERIRMRQLQRRGLSYEQAEALNAVDLAAIDGERFDVIGVGTTLEAAWELAYERAEGGLLVVVDALQKVHMAGLDGHGQRERIDAALRALQACQQRWPATVLATSEATADGTAKGSTGIGHAADVELALTRDGSRVRVRIEKYRRGRETPFDLVLDGERQTVLDPEAAALADADAELWGRVRTVLVEVGAASQNELERRLRGKAAAVRACIKRHLELGELVRVGQKLRLA